MLGLKFNHFSKRGPWQPNCWGYYFSKRGPWQPNCWGHYPGTLPCSLCESFKDLAFYLQVSNLQISCSDLPQIYDSRIISGWPAPVVDTSLSSWWLSTIPVWYTYVDVIKHICGINFDALKQGDAYNPQGNRKIILDEVGIKLTIFRLRQNPQMPVVQHVHFMPQNLC